MGGSILRHLRVEEAQTGCRCYNTPACLPRRGARMKGDPARLKLLQTLDTSRPGASHASQHR